MSREQSILDFQAAIRNLFGFLVEEYGFRELPAKAHHALSFENENIGVDVKGVHWGQGAEVNIRPVKNIPESEFVSVPLWAIIKISYPEKYDAFDSVEGQIPQAKASSEFMREMLPGLLGGDTSQLTESRRFLEKRVEAVRNGTWQS